MSDESQTPAPPHAPEAPQPSEATAAPPGYRLASGAEAALGIALFASSADCVKLLQPDGRLLAVNRAGLALMDAADETVLLSLPWQEAWHDETRPRALDALARAGAGDVARFRGTTVTLAGTRRVVDVTLTPVRDADGRVTRLVHVARDLTARIDAERARADAETRLRASEALAWMLFRDDPLPKWVFDVDTLRILDVNEAALRSYGYTRDEFLALTILDLRPPADRAALAERRPSFGPGYAQLGRFRHMRRSGEVFDVEIVRHDTHVDGRRARVVVAIDITQRVAAERALRDSEERYALALRAVSDVLWDRDLASGRTTVLGGGLAQFGLEPAQVEADWSVWTTLIHPADAAAVAHGFMRAVAGGREVTEWQHEYRVRRPDGTWRRIADRAVIVRDPATGRATRVIGIAKDVTVERDLADRLRQAQKMEAVGQLAGGVAHDFNNLLTIIGMNLELAADDLATGDDVRPRLDEIQLATRQASTLVRQLLTFSRRAEVRPADVSLGDAVRGAERLLRRVIGEEIVLDVAITRADVPVHVDAGELEQLLMNLVVNARDAMLTPLHGHAGRGGSLTIEVDAVPFPPDARDDWTGAPPARVARLRVRDTGHGMDDATRRRIFEPFFTTKDVGRGTGIGLATVFGIVSRAGGAIVVETAPGAGATFDVLLPLATTATIAQTPTPSRSATVTRRATVLLVEDETAVRAAARRMLERRGYVVLEARHGIDALDVWRAHGAGIDAIVTDVRMPELGGPELIAQLRTQGATVPVVYLTGYAEHPVVASPDARERVVGKPFDSATLAEALEAVLAAG